MQISMRGKYMLNVLGHRTTLAKFQTKVKSSMKVYNVRLLAKIMINEHILPIFAH